MSDGLENVSSVSRKFPRPGAQVGKSAALKRPASAVRFRPWPPSFQAIMRRPSPKYVPIRSKNQIARRGLSLFLRVQSHSFHHTYLREQPLAGYQLAAEVD